MVIRRFICIFIGFIAVFGVDVHVFGAEHPESANNSQYISFFHPSGINGFIVYDVDSTEPSSELSYGNRSFDLSSPLGLPVTVVVEGFNITDGSYEVQKILQNTEMNYLEIFSIQHALTYGSKSSLSPLYPGKADITMVVVSANFQATNRFSAKLSTGLSQAMKEKSGTDATLGYELDIAGFYEIAPGLTFSVGAGYATNTDFFNDTVHTEDEKRSWSLNSKFRLRF